MTNDAKKLFENSLVWDMTLPWVGGTDEAFVLLRFRAAGTKGISLAVDSDHDFTPNSILSNIASIQKQGAATAPSIPVACWIRLVNRRGRHLKCKRMCRKYFSREVM